LAEKASLGESVGTRRVSEITTTGVDEWLQALGGDPYGGSSSVGLRIPGLATTNTNRYLFLLASFSIPTGIKARIVGYRQLLTLGVATSAPGEESPGRFVEQEVTSPFFRLPDGNVSWHIQRLGPPNAQGFPPGNRAEATDLRSFKKKWSEGPALLYETATNPNQFYVDLTAYTPPNGGKPWGTPLRAGEQGTFYDLRANWRDDRAWTSLDMELEGPDTVAFFASVRQSAGASAITAPSPFFSEGLSPEEQFLLNFPSGVKYWRVGGALMIEVEP